MTKKDDTPKKPVAAKSTPAPRATQKVKREPSIYIGPSLRGGRLARYTVFKGGDLPAGIDAIAKEHKAVQRLIVPVSKLAEAEQRLKDASSLEAAMYAQAAKIFSNEGGK